MKKLFLPLLTLLLVSVAGNAFAQPDKPRLNHVALYVKDLASMTRFYRDVIGLDTIPEPFRDNRHTWFQIGEHSHLHLIQGAATITPHPKNAHLCFSVGSIDAFIARLKRFNVPYEAWNGDKYAVTNRVDGVQQIYLQDPENYWVEINNDQH